VKRLHELAQQHPRYGYDSRPTRAGRGSPLCWRITVKLNEEHWHVNRKRVQRLWCAEGLKVPRKTHKRKRLGDGENACHRYKPEYPHHVWALDFLVDTTLNGGRLKFLVRAQREPNGTVLDEYSRACLSIKVECCMTGYDVRGELERLMTLHGPPGFIRCDDRRKSLWDNGPEFIARATRRFLAEAGVGTLFIDPGAPWRPTAGRNDRERLQRELHQLLP